MSTFSGELPQPCGSIQAPGGNADRRARQFLKYCNGRPRRWPRCPRCPAAVDAVARAAAAIVEPRAQALAGGQTLAQLYDVLRHPGRSTLRSLHDELDRTVMAAYDFDPEVDVIAQLLSLNLAAAAERAGDPVTAPGAAGPGCRQSDWRLRAD